ncbi:MAG TPA: DUF4260 family protein [Acidobacteriaceae bacterium]|nr:DUF4260 family protein [Acidobacteriaceae bacterium]
MLTRPDWLLRIEGLLVLVASMVCFSALLHGHWLFFALLFLAPDLALIGYLAKSYRRGAAALYNTAHSYALRFFWDWQPGRGTLWTLCRLPISGLLISLSTGCSGLG